MLRLNDKDREVLSCVALQGNLEVPEIARQTRLRQHTVRYALSRFRQTQAIQVYPFIDMYTLGYVQHELSFSLRSEKIQHKDQLINWLLKHPQIAFVGEISGAYNYVVTVCTRDLHELQLFFEEFSRSFGDLVFAQDVTARLAFYALRCRTFSTKKSYGPRYLRFGVSDDRCEIDELDHKILCMLDRNGFGSRREIARSLGINASTLSYRIKSLEKRKVIRGYDSVIFHRNLGGFTSYMVLLRVRGIPSEFRKRLLDYSVKDPSIATCAEGLGQWDFKLSVVVRDPRDIVGVIEALQQNFGTELHDVITLSYFQARKVSRYPFSMDWPVKF